MQVNCVVQTFVHKTRRLSCVGADNHGTQPDDVLVPDVQQSIYFRSRRVDENLDEGWTTAVDTAVVDVAKATCVKVAVASCTE